MTGLNLYQFAKLIHRLQDLPAELVNKIFDNLPTCYVDHFSKSKQFQKAAVVNIFSRKISLKNENSCAITHSSCDDDDDFFCDHGISIERLLHLTALYAILPKHIECTELEHFNYLFDHGYELFAVAQKIDLHKRRNTPVVEIEKYTRNITSKRGKMLRINRMVCDTIDSRDFPVPRSVKHFKFEDEAAYDVNFFQNMEELESLQIGGDSKFPLLALGRLPSTLTELDIPYLNSLETCSGIPRKLKKWKLVYDEFDYSDSDAHHISMTTAGSNNVPRFEQLEELDIGCCSFSSLFQYGVFTNLKKLRMQVPHGGMSSEWELLAQRECRALEELQVISNHFPTLLFCAEYELPRLRLFKYQQSSETVDQTEEMEREHGVALHFPKRLERLELEVGPNLVLDMEKFSVPETLKVLVLRNNVDNCRRFEQLKLPPNLEIFAVRADGGSGGGDIDLKNFIFPLQLKQLYLEGFQCLDLTGSNLQDLNNLEHIKIENVQQENSRTFRDSEDGNGFVTTSATNQWRGEQRSALTPEHEI